MNSSETQPFKFSRNNSRQRLETRRSAIVLLAAITAVPKLGNALTKSSARSGFAMIVKIVVSRTSSAQQLSLSLCMENNSRSDWDCPLLGASSSAWQAAASIACRTHDLSGPLKASMLRREILVTFGILIIYFIMIPKSHFTITPMKVVPWFTNNLFAAKTLLFT